MDTGEPQRPSRVAARPGTTERPGAPADPRTEAQTGGTPRPRSSQSGTGGQARPRTAGASKGTGSKGNGASGNGAKAATKAKPGAPKKRPAPVPASPAAAAPADAPPAIAPAPAAVAVVDTEHDAPSAAPAPAPAPTRPNGRIVTPPPLRSLPESPADRSLPAPGPIELPTIVPAEPDVPTHSAPATTAVPTVPVWPDGTGPDGTDTDTDGTAGLPSLRRAKRPARALRAPKVLPRPRRPRVRKVTRVVRHVDTWSVFKVALVFNAFVYAVCLVAGVLLWQVAQNTGTVDNVERFFETFGWESFELKGGEIYHAAWVAGLFLGVGGTGLIVLAATLFNLITDLVGGIRVTVLEEEVVVRDERGLGWRRARRAAPPPDTEPHAQSHADPHLDPDVAMAHPAPSAPAQPAEQPG